jgi:hypothetical protein
MVWQLRDTMSRYHLDEGLMSGTDASAGPGWTTARVVRGFDSSDSGSIYHMGLGADVKIFDKQGRYVDPTTDEGRSNYALFMKGAEAEGFKASLIASNDGQSYIRLQYTPGGWDRNDGKLITNTEVKAHRTQMNWHMQDLRKHFWKAAHGSYWRLRYAMNNPIRPK